MNYPSATQHRTPNQERGNDGRAAVCIHVAEGGYSGTIQHILNPRSRVSYHFLVGQTGQIAQFVSTHNTAWGNGLFWDAPAKRWLNPRKEPVTPTWTGLTPAVNPNRQTISISHAGNFADPRPDAQISATVDLLVWLGTHYPDLADYRVGETLIGHRDLDPIDRPNCPGAVDLAQLAALANARRDVWHAWGTAFPLAPTQRDWAIPRAWRAAVPSLGEARSYEHYVDGATSIQTFARGWITYESRVNVARVFYRTGEVTP